MDEVTDGKNLNVHAYLYTYTILTGTTVRYTLKKKQDVYSCVCHSPLPSPKEIFFYFKNKIEIGCFELGSPTSFPSIGLSSR